MIKKSRDDKFVIKFHDENNITIETVAGYSPTVFDLAIVIQECFQPKPNERLTVDKIHFVVNAGSRIIAMQVERKHCLLIYLEEISKMITL